MYVSMCACISRHIHPSTYHPPPLTTHPNARPHPPKQCVTGLVQDWHAADMWSLGICLYMMLTGRPLYRGPDDEAFALLAGGGAPGLLHFYAR